MTESRLNFPATVSSCTSCVWHICIRFLRVFWHCLSPWLFISFTFMKCFFLFQFDSALPQTCVLERSLNMLKFELLLNTHFRPIHFSHVLCVIINFHYFVFPLFGRLLNLQFKLLKIFLGMRVTCKRFILQWHHVFSELHFVHFSVLHYFLHLLFSDGAVISDVILKLFSFNRLIEVTDIF